MNLRAAQHCIPALSILVMLDCIDRTRARIDLNHFGALNLAESPRRSLLSQKAGAGDLFHGSCLGGDL